MQILLKNSSKSASYECDFRDTDVIYCPDGRIKYKLGDNDMISNFRCIGNLEYQAKYGDVNCGLLDYYVFFSNNKAYLDVQNSTNATYVRLNLSLTNHELDRIKSITRL